MKEYTKDIIIIALLIFVIFGFLYYLSSKIAINIHNMTGYNTEDIRGVIFAFFTALMVIKYA